MPGGRGGRRKGTPGKGYQNRTDLMADYSPSTAEHTPASGGVEAPPPQRPPVYPEDIPKLDDPTGRPQEPVTAGLGQFIGGQNRVLADPSMAILRAAYNRNPTPQLARTIRLMETRYGRL